MVRSRVFFNQKPLHRERQADTVRFASEFFDVFSPLKKNVDNLATEKVGRGRYIKIISYILNKIPIINIRKLSRQSDEVDIIYTWGDIPLFPKKPFMVELDNPYVLTFYNYLAFRLYKPIIKFLLKKDSCKKIVCISDACRKTFLQEMGSDFINKTVVLYPRVIDTNQNSNKKEAIQFLFVGLSGRGKGLHELLEAFHQVDSQDINLNLIGFRDLEIEKRYMIDERIKFLGQIPRKEILGKYMPESDVLLFPTYFESFGMVALEALSHGLGIITTNVFALPELVKNGYNGKILKHPYLNQNEHGFVDVTKMTIGCFYKKYLEDKPLSQDLIDQLKDAINIAIKDFEDWKENSKLLYEEKFSENAWKKSFLSLFND